MYTQEDSKYMLRAVELALKGRGWVNPNPLVGAVIVKDGRIIGEGYHQKYGELHAERNALKNAAEDVRGATMYVTLEPCCHFGKQPPCTDAILASGIKRVVVGMTDPNPLVAGKGIAILRSAAVEVEAGVEQERIEDINRVFIKYITTRMPWVAVKSAMTLDGKIATVTGDSRWVSGQSSRDAVHLLRSLYSGILVGRGTVDADDPMLTNRLDGSMRQPVRIIADSRCSILPSSALVTTARRYRTVVAHTSAADNQKIELLRSKGVEMLLCDSDADGRIDMRSLMEALGAMKIDSVLVEGGAAVNFSIISCGLADEYYGYIAPKMVGGAIAPSPVGGKGIELMGNAVELYDTEVKMSGEDILVHGYFKN